MTKQQPGLNLLIESSEGSSPFNFNYKSSLKSHFISDVDSGTTTRNKNNVETWNFLTTPSVFEAWRGFPQYFRDFDTLSLSLATDILKRGKGCSNFRHSAPVLLYQRKQLSEHVWVSLAECRSETDIRLEWLIVISRRVDHSRYFCENKFTARSTVGGKKGFNYLI